MKKVAFFHGLESPCVSNKSDYLLRTFGKENCYLPCINYRSANAFRDVLKNVEAQSPDILMGSSMGGWFAYCISTLTGIPTLLFNPALQGRSFDPSVKTGSQTAQHTIILGAADDVILPGKTLEWLKEKGISAEIHWEKMGHRTPITIFSKWVRKM